MKRNPYLTTEYRDAIDSALRTVRAERETPDTCLHFGVNWRALKPGRDGRLHASCPNCRAKVSRSAFAQ